MIGAVAPQKRGVVPPEHAAAIAAAKARMDESAEGYRQAIADALKAGASVREVSWHTGLAMATVHKWGSERGWPTPEQKAQPTYQRNDERWRAEQRQAREDRGEA